ncbi:MAG: hypothetical protein HDQ96_14105 [Lachnospiraceae bacterium]|nr:hypothetical protein [Lachnospiraceae bacterium]
MRRKKPIYTIRKDTCLASDYIKPYGNRIEVSSESKRRKMALKLLNITKKSDTKKSEEDINNE